MQWTDQRALPASAEIAMLRVGLNAHPDALGYRLRLARLLCDSSRHVEAGEVAAEGLARFQNHPAFRVALGECRNALGDPESAHAVLTDLPEELAPNTLVHGLHELGTAKEALGRRTEAKHTYRRALQVKPDAPHPCKSLHALLRTEGDIAGVLHSCNTLRDRGVDHGRVTADRMVATALLGRKSEALDTFAFDRFAHVANLAHTADLGGWSDIDAFNRSVVAELGAHPDLQFGRRHTASREGWRVQSPFSGHGRPALDMLKALVRREVDRYAMALPDAGHLFSDRRPERVAHSDWAVKVGAGGFEEWHVHPAAWLTAVYYAAVPAAIADGEGTAGCVTFGLPDYDGMPEPGRDWTTIRPRSGMLLLFPSHCFHRTWPTGLDEARWIVAFDIMPSAA